jgi:purine-nucleoside phosphorylase
VPEVVVAVHGKLRVLGFSVITDMCLPDALQPVSHEEIVAVAGAAEEKLGRVVRRLLEGLP